MWTIFDAIAQLATYNYVIPHYKSLYNLEVVFLLAITWTTSSIPIYDKLELDFLFWKLVIERFSGLITRNCSITEVNWEMDYLIVQKAKYSLWGITLIKEGRFKIYLKSFNPFRNSINIFWLLIYIWNIII